MGRSNLTYPDRRGQKGSRLLPHINGAIEVLIPALIILSTLRSMTSLREARTTPRYEKSSGGERLNLFTHGTLSVSSSCFVVQLSTTLSYLLCTRCQKPGVLGTLAQLEAQERNIYRLKALPLLNRGFGKERQKKFHFGELGIPFYPSSGEKSALGYLLLLLNGGFRTTKPLIELKAHLWYPAQ